MSSSSQEQSLYIVSEKASLSSLVPNQFHKICPSSSSGGDQPVCGDGSEFCFYVSRPPQRSHNNNRLLIEMLGGGACWDADTCDAQSSYLYVPEIFDKFLGHSCSEIQYSTAETNSGKPINMLCAGSLGETDLSGYNTVIVPYCTQDVHIGSNTIDYDGTTVNHSGSHNMMAVLRWVYRNLPNLEHAVVTGCSAGGTAVPIIYRLLDKHYNRFGLRSAQISVISDSPVYLTPTYFLENAIGNWNPNKLLGSIGIPYQRFRQSEDYPSLTWNWIMKKGSNHDRWGFLSHTYDPVSQMYYQKMSGDQNDDDNNNNRRLEDISDEWFSKLSASLASVQENHKNLETYWISDSQGHCSFGLYYGLLESDFGEWAGAIVKEERLISQQDGAIAFFVSLAAGAGLVALVWMIRKKRLSKVQTGPFKDGLLNSDADAPSSWNTRFQTKLAAISSTVEPNLMTAAYATITSLYFWTMIANEGFAHILNNPSLGPNALGLSAYGILNPSLVVLRFQLYRLVTSTFLCSGVLTYIYTMANLWFRVRDVEQRLQNPFIFCLVAILVLSVGNLCFCLADKHMQGASCSSVVLVMGLHAYGLSIKWKNMTRKCLSIFSFLLELFVLSILFPFNSGLMLVLSIITGVVASTIFPANSTALHGTVSAHRSFAISKRKGLPTVCALKVATVVVLLTASPDSTHLDPFFTGCDMYWTDQVGDFVEGNFLSNDDDAAGNDRRLRILLDYDVVCAQVCVPNLVSPFVTRGSTMFGVSSIKSGVCTDQGYTLHALDKTFHYATYSLDAEVYYPEDYYSNRDA